MPKSLTTKRKSMCACLCYLTSNFSLHFKWFLAVCIRKVFLARGFLYSWNNNNHQMSSFFFEIVHLPVTCRKLFGRTQLEIIFLSFNFKILFIKFVNLFFWRNEIHEIYCISGIQKVLLFNFFWHHEATFLNFQNNLLIRIFYR